MICFVSFFPPRYFCVSGCWIPVGTKSVPFFSSTAVASQPSSSSALLAAPFLNVEEFFFRLSRKRTMWEFNLKQTSISFLRFLHSEVFKSQNTTGFVLFSYSEALARPFALHIKATMVFLCFGIYLPFLCNLIFIFLLFKKMNNTNIYSQAEENLQYWLAAEKLWHSVLKYSGNVP